MKRTYYFLFLCFAVFLSCNSQKSKKINGLSFVASSDSLTMCHVQPVKNVNANYVSLMPFGFIKELNAPNIRFNAKWQWFGEKKEGIKQYASGFNKEQIQVMVKPQIWVSNGAFTGFIKMESEAQWKELERTYSTFILSFAEVAEAINAPIFCIGTELEQFVINRPNYWNNLIVEIRKRYKGKLTYAANWDEFKRVPFWDRLDYIGIDAYFPLSDIKTPSVLELEKGWKTHKEVIQTIQKKYNKPVLFTEFGYRSVHYTAKKPWKVDRFKGNIDLVGQSNATQAIYNQFWNEDWFAGGFLWKWFLNHKNVGGVNNNRFTPQNKPAETLIQTLYSQ